MPPCSTLPQVSPGGKFAFVELADVQDTTNAMCLDGLPYMGTVLRIGRPKGYTPTLNVSRGGGVGGLAAAAAAGQTVLRTGIGG